MSLHKATDPIIIVEFAPEIEGDVSRPLLGAEEAAKIRALLPVTGIEALAWYVPFHQRAYQWGCYLSVSGILALCDVLLPLGLAPSRRVELAVCALLRHEVTHFAVEYMAAQWELSLGKSCYWTARDRLKNPQGYISIEERLANAYMLRGFRFPSEVTRCAGSFDLLKQYTDLMPEGYRHGQYCVEAKLFRAIMSDVTHDYVSCFPPATYQPRYTGLDLLAYFPSVTAIDVRYAPIFLVDDNKVWPISSFVIRLIPSIQQIDETLSFQKMLSKLGSSIERAWNETKRKLKSSTLLRGLDFKLWKEGDDLYSVRVTASVRAHLQLIRPSARWLALKIGGHDAMGH